MTTINLPLLCFNDVYRVNQRFVPQPGSPPVASGSKAESDHISVSQFGQLLRGERAKWADRQEKRWDGEPEKEGLVLFAGDVFNPSVESSVTRGSHMVPIMNALQVDVACIGNHDFDFGYPHLTRLLNATQFPWLLSNIVDSNTSHQPDRFERYWITERCGVKIGVIGIVEQDWIATIPSWPPNFSYRSAEDTVMELSKELRDPNGEHRVDIIIALTHARVPNDIKLANQVGAVANFDGVENKHGADLLIGGHDHIYYIGKGADKWDGFAGERGVPGTEDDRGVRLIKSGTDFRDLSSANLELVPTAEGSIRRYVVNSLTGKHHYILPTDPYCPPIDEMLKSLLSSVEGTLQKSVAFTLTPFDARSEIVRTRETGLGNWLADVLMHAYAESLIDQDNDGKNYMEKDGKNDLRAEKGGADAVLLCGGTLRGDSQYGPGKVTLGDILEILPFEDPIVCIEIDGKGIWDALESALSKWPAQEGRFPIVSGIQVVWDHTKPPNQRIASIHLLNPPLDDDGVEDAAEMVDFVEQEDGTRVEVKQRKMVIGDEVKREEGGKIYRVITRQYMADGYDGFAALKDRKFIVDDETGQIMSSIIRSFLLGSLYIFRHKQLRDAHQSHLSAHTEAVLSRARAQHQSSPVSSAASSPRSVRSSLPHSHLPPVHSPLSPLYEDRSASTESSAYFDNADNSAAKRRHVVQHDWRSIRDAMHVGRTEHMSSVDSFHGHDIRYSADSKALPSIGNIKKTNETKAGATFLVDEKRKDELKSLADDLAIVCPLVDGRLKDVAA